MNSRVIDRQSSHCIKGENSPSLHQHRPGHGRRAAQDDRVIGHIGYRHIVSSRGHTAIRPVAGRGPVGRDAARPRIRSGGGGKRRVQHHGVAAIGGFTAWVGLQAHFDVVIARGLSAVSIGGLPGAAVVDAVFQYADAGGVHHDGARRGGASGLGDGGERNCRRVANNNIAQRKIIYTEGVFQVLVWNAWDRVNIQPPEAKGIAGCNIQSRNGSCNESRMLD